MIETNSKAIQNLHSSVIEHYLDEPKFEDDFLVSTERPKMTTKSTKTSTKTTTTITTTTSEAPPKTAAIVDPNVPSSNNNNKQEEEHGQDNSHSSPWWMVGALLGGIALLIGAIVGAKTFMENRAAGGYAEATLVANQEDFSDKQSIVQDQQQNN